MLDSSRPSTCMVFHADTNDVGEQRGLTGQIVMNLLFNPAQVLPCCGSCPHPCTCQLAMARNGRLPAQPSHCCHHCCCYCCCCLYLHGFSATDDLASGAALLQPAIARCAGDVALVGAPQRPAAVRHRGEQQQRQLVESMQLPAARAAAVHWNSTCCRGSQVRKIMAMHVCTCVPMPPLANPSHVMFAAAAAGRHRA